MYGYYEVTPKPTEEELRDYYSEKYYQDEMATYSNQYSEEERIYFWNKIVQKDFVVTQQLEQEGKKRLLDIGCGEGFTLDYYDKKGWDVTGVDFSDFGLRNNHPSLLDCLQHGDLFEQVDRLVKSEQRFDVVWLDNVLEHVLDPIKLLTQSLELTKNGGVLVIEVPNDYSSLQVALVDSGKVARKYWEAYPDHLNYFSFQSLRKICESNGWTTSKIISDFPIEWNLANPNSNYVNNKNVGKAVHNGRMFVENFLHRSNQSNMSELIDFYEAMAKVGQGRQLIGFFTKNEV